MTNVRNERKKRARARKQAEAKMYRQAEGRWRQAAGVVPKASAIRLADLRWTVFDVMCRRCGDLRRSMSAKESRAFIIGHRHGVMPGRFAVNAQCRCGQWVWDSCTGLHDCETDAALHFRTIHQHD